MAMIFADGRGRAKKRQRQEEQTRNFQPEDVQDSSDTPQGNAAGPVESPYPTVFTGFSARHS